MAEYATVKDVQVRYGRPIPEGDQAEQVEAWLTDVETTIRAEIPGFDEGVALLGSPSRDVVRMVVATAVLRRLRNPDGLRTVTTSVDDGSVTKTRGGSPVADGTTWLTDAEWALLEPQQNTEAASIRYAYTPGYGGGPQTPWGRP